MVLSVAEESTVPPELAMPIYEATDLTKGGDLARIKLQDQLYTLRITRSGKLILTK